MTEGQQQLPQLPQTDGPKTAVASASASGSTQNLGTDSAADSAANTASNAASNDPAASTQPPAPMAPPVTSAQASTAPPARLIAGPSSHVQPNASASSASRPTINPASATNLATTAVSFAHLRDPHRALVQLLDESTGAELFKAFVEEHGGIHSARLNFYFACEGLKQQTDDAKVRQMVAAIYKFLQKSEMTLDKDLRARIKAGLKQTAAAMDANIFNGMQSEVVAEMCRTTFPEFYKEQRHIDHVNALAAAAAAAGGSEMEAGQRQPVQQQQPPPPQPPPRPQPALPPQQQQQQRQHSSQTQQQQLPTSSQWLSSPIVGPPSMMPPPAMQHHQQQSHQSHQQQHHFNQHHLQLLDNDRALMTVHEDSELSSCDPPSSASAASAGAWMPLTSSALMATQTGRLAVRPNGAHSYVGQFSSAYNPVSLQNSECQSISSGGYGKTGDPELARQISRVREGRTDHHRRTSEQASTVGSAAMPSSSGGIATSSSSSAKPHQHINQHVHLPPHPHNMPSHLGASGASGKPLSGEDFKLCLLPKLEALKHQRDNYIDPSAARLSRGVFVNANQFSTLHSFADDDQSILDEHVSRVWDKSPLLSPGTKSPYPTMGGVGGVGGEMFGAGDAFGVGSMRHSQRSMGAGKAGGGAQMSPMYAMEMQKQRMEQQQGVGSRTMASAQQQRGLMGVGSEQVQGSKTLEEARRRLEDVSRPQQPFGAAVGRPHPQPHYSQEAPLPPPPAQVNARTHESTVALISLPNEQLRYRYKLPGLHPTLRQFKEILPKKGNFRFFFKTACDDPDNPIIQQEIDNDADLLPLFDGKVDCNVKEYE